MPKKDLALQAYGYVYVARVAMGADPPQTLRAFREAEAYDGPSLIIAAAASRTASTGSTGGCRAVASGYWPLVRYDPMVRAEPVPAQLTAARIALADYTQRELRYRALANAHP